MNQQRTSLVFTRAAFDNLISYLHNTLEMESMAIGLFKFSDSSKALKILVNQVIIPEEKDYLERTPSRVSLRPEFLEGCFQKCEENRLHLLDIHTHPWSANPEFSPIDDHEAAITKVPYLSQYLPDVRIAFLLFGKSESHPRTRLWNRASQEFDPIHRILIT